jgi:predicted Zn-dependent protease
MNWTIESLKNELRSNSLLTGWIVIEEAIHRRERYFLQDGAAIGIDQDREVHAKSVQVRLLVDICKSGRQGEITKKLFTGSALMPQLSSAIEAAKKTDHQAWRLPSDIPEDIPDVKSCDPGMLADLNTGMDRVTDEIMRCALSHQDTQFNSAELFMSVHERALHLPNGLVHQSRQSRIYVEAAYSFARSGKSDEYLQCSWAIHPEDISVPQLFAVASDRAMHSLDVIKPESKKYSVILDAEVLATLINGCLFQLSARSEYHQLPFKKVGDEFVPGATGDLLTVRLDPTLAFGADSVSVSDHGVVQRPMVLVDNNRVAATATDPQHGSYLGRAASTYRGNMVVDAGSMTYDQLCTASPQVLEILQFSGLFFSEDTGTFSSEIRLARLHDNITGKMSYVKGGSLSGSIGENFKHALLSNNMVKHTQIDYGSAVGYFGPEFVLLTEVSVVS